MVRKIHDRGIVFVSYLHMYNQFWMLIIAGVAATIVMTFTAKVLALIAGAQLSPERVLNRLFAYKENHITGTLLHYTTGIFFAFTYAALWSCNIGSPGFASGIIFGICNGLFAVLVWNTILLFRPVVTELSQPEYLLVIFLAHIPFSLVVHLSALAYATG